MTKGSGDDKNIMIQKFSILGVPISAVNLDLAAEAIDQWIQNREKRYVCIAPVSTVMTCQDDPAYRAVIENADMVTPDGMPVVWLGRRQGFEQVSRTYGPDLMPLICKRGQDKGYRHYFYGGSEETLRRLETRFQTRYPRIQFAGLHAPPFRELTPDELQADLDRINESHADILWVGLGSPKQDFWIAQNRDKLNTPVLIAVGAAFDFHAGTKAQAPRWMQRIGLEWLFRFCHEPSRLWKRYLIGNPRFVFLLAWESLKKRLAK